MSASTANLLKIGHQLKTSKIKLCTFSGERLPVLGLADIKLNYKNDYFSVKFYVVNINCKNIIGIKTAVIQNLIKQIKSISINEVIERNSEVFSGLGCLQNKCNFMIRDDIEPIVEVAGYHLNY